MQLFVSSLIGFALRYFAHSANNTISLILLGSWEGICLHHLSSTAPSSYDPYLAYALRLCLDFFLTRNIARTFLIVLWSFLSNFASDALSDQHFYDTTHEKRAHARRVSSTAREAPVTSRTQTQTHTRRRSTTRVISPISSGMSADISATSPSIPVREPPPPAVEPTSISTTSSSPVIVSPDPASHIDALPVPIPVFAGGQPPAAPAVDSTPSDFQQSLPKPIIGPQILPVITDPLTPIHEGPEFLPLTTPATATDAEAGAPYDGDDELQTPVLQGVVATIPSPGDQLMTPQSRSILLSTSERDEGADVDERVNTIPVAPRPIIYQPFTMGPSRSNSGTPVPVPVPAPRVGSPPNAHETVASPVDSVISATEPAQIFARAESLREQAWREVELQRQLKLDLEKATRERNTKEAFLLSVDLEESKKKIYALHNRARKRYLAARNPTEARDSGVVDVHGLLVPEAIEVTELAFRDALRSGKSSLEVIVGKGKHSADKIPKLKPAVERAMKKHGIDCVVKPRNTGVLLLTLRV